MIPQWQDTCNRFAFSDSQKCKKIWHNLRSNYMRERRKSKKKKNQEVEPREIEMAVLQYREFLGTLLASS
jgi:hypothetical protein